MIAPNPPPRGGAGPRVSDDKVRTHCAPYDRIVRLGISLNEDAMAWLDLRDARAECADLRAKLEAAEAEVAWLRQRNLEAATLAFGWMAAHDNLKSGLPYSFPKPADLPESKARADAAEAALREMTEQRDGAREAALDAAAARLMLWADEQALSVPPEGWSPSALLRQAATSLAALSPPAETAAKEKRT